MKAYTKELVEKVKDEIYGAYWSTLTDAQRSFIDDQIAKRFPGVKPTENTAKTDVIQNTTVPGAESPTSTNSPIETLKVSKISYCPLKWCRDTALMAKHWTHNVGVLSLNPLSKPYSQFILTLASWSD